MKKILLFAVMAVFAVSASAQTLGVKAGFNGANIGGDVGGDMKISFYLGATAEFTLCDKFSVQPELVYSRQGASDKLAGVKYKLRYNYINVPIMAKYYVSDKWSFEAGPQVGFALNAKSVAKNDGDKVSSKIDSDTYKTVDFAIGVGTSYKFCERMGASLRYNFGVSSILEDVTGRNNVLQIGLTYSF